MQVARLSLDPGIVAIGRRQAQSALHRDVGTQRRQLLDHLIDQRIQVDALEVQRRRALLEPCVSEHFVDQSVEILNVVVHAFTVLFQGLRRGGRTNHLQTETQARHRRTQLVGNGAHQFALDCQQLLQVFGHAVERRRQTPHRVRAACRHTGFQATPGDARGRCLKTAQAALQLANQQVNDQTDQREAQCGNQHEPFRRIRIHLIQRADFQDPWRPDHASEHADRIALLAQRHHRVTFGHSTTLVLVHVRLIDRDQTQVEAKTLVLLQLCQALGLLGHRHAHQFIGQQVNRRPRQLLTDLLDFPREYQLFLFADQPVNLRRMRTGLLHQRLPVQHAGALGQVKVRLVEGFQRQRNPQQAFPH